MKTSHDARNRIDRRVVRTRARLQDALIALIAERGYSAVTVESLCERADVGRSTFYAQYPDKEALRRATIDAHFPSGVVGRGAGAGGASPGGLAFSGPLLDHADAFRGLHRAMLASGDDDIHDEIRERVRRAVRAETGRHGIQDEPAVQFVAGAFLGLLSWWLAEETGLGVAEIDRRFQAMALGALRGACHELEPDLR